MADLLTTIRIDGHPRGYGLADWGELTADEIIRQYRAMADHLRQQVAAIDATPDNQFRIEIVRGSVVQKLVRIIQAPTTPQEAGK